tara:strand:- start:1550 stop:1948 length:399 start_codon:yes stop_codon:yes gene_type:complete
MIGAGDIADKILLNLEKAGYVYLVESDSFRLSLLEAIRTSYAEGYKKELANLNARSFFVPVDLLTSLGSFVAEYKNTFQMQINILKLHIDECGDADEGCPDCQKSLYEITLLKWILSEGEKLKTTEDELWLD